MSKISNYDILLRKIKYKTAKVAVVGLGYVGTPLLKLISKKGYTVTGLDIQKEKIKKLKKENKNIFFTNKYEDLAKTDVIIIALPTPIKNFLPDLSYIKNSLEKILKVVSKPILLILESTNYPGSTREIVIKKLKKKYSVGENFFVSYSPERVDPGNKKFSINNIPKICSGYSTNCLNLSYNFYKKICKKPIRSSSLENAEMAKLFENIFRFVNISLVNELKIFSKLFKIDINEVIDLASTKPFGFMKFEPGPGIGGHCIPVDPFYFTWKAKQKKLTTKFVNLAARINNNMPKYISNEIINIFNKRKIRKKITNILILGLSYKKDIDDIRNSPAKEILSLLSQKDNIRISYNDNYIRKVRINKKTFKSMNIKNFKTLNKFDFVIILTDHTYFKKINFKKVKTQIIDTRNFINSKNLIRI